jgi:hypothetical protein
VPQNLKNGAKCAAIRKSLRNTGSVTKLIFHQISNYDGLKVTMLRNNRINPIEKLLFSRKLKFHRRVRRREIT